MSDNFTPLAVKTRQAGDIVAGLVGLAGERLAIAAGGEVTEINSAPILAALQAIQAVDFSTASGQDAALAELQAIRGFVDDVETQLADIHSATSLLGSEATLLQIRLLTESLEACLQSMKSTVELIEAKDFATEATLDEVRDRLDYTAADGAAAPGRVAVTGGLDAAGLVQAFRLDATGRLIVASDAAEKVFRSSGTLHADIAAGQVAVLRTQAVAALSTLEKVVISSAAPLKAEIEVWDAATSLIVKSEAVIFTKAGETFQYEIEGGTIAQPGQMWQVTLKNMDSEVTTRAYTTVHWHE